MRYARVDAIRQEFSYSDAMALTLFHIDGSVSSATTTRSGGITTVLSLGEECQPFAFCVDKPGVYNTNKGKLVEVIRVNPYHVLALDFYDWKILVLPREVSTPPIDGTDDRIYCISYVKPLNPEKYGFAGWELKKEE